MHRHLLILRDLKICQPKKSAEALHFTYYNYAFNDE